MKSQVTPLKVWGWVLCIFVLSQILIAIAFFFVESKGNQSRNEHYFDQINYIQQEFKKDNSSYKTIIIGTSLIGHGVECPNEITNYLSSKKKTDIKLLKIWSRGDQLKRFISLNLIDDVINAKPDLVIFQTGIAVIKFPNENPNMIQKLSSIYRTVIRYFLSPKHKIIYNSKNRCYPDNLDEQKNLDTVTYIPRKREVKTMDDLDFALEGFTLLQKEGIKTILVDIPRPVQSEKIIYTKSFNEQLQKLLNTYNKNFGIEHWSYTGTPIYYKHCIDEHHFNIEGRSLYTKWLLDKIEKEI
jgi:hypothetical protein